MTELSPTAACPCGSGFVYDACCGIADRTAREPVAVVRTNGTLRTERLSASLRAALDSVDTCPDLFPARISFGADTAYWVKMSPRWYAESVFLDPARIRGCCVIETDLAWLATAADRAVAQPSAFIFHTAFCGSTLMSQALAELYHCLPLREPEALGNLMFRLRSLAPETRRSDVWPGRILRLLARRYHPAAPAVIKANDYANGLIEDLLAWQPDLPLLFMYTPLAEFVVGCLKADNRRDWIRDRYSIIRVDAPHLLHTPAALGNDAIAEMAAVYWAYNIALYLAAWRNAPQHLRSLDFTRMLEAPRDTVDACARLFGLTAVATADAADRLAALLGVYSKNAEFRYSPAQRRNELMRLAQKYATDIETAERRARDLLGERYPEAALPGALA